MVATPGDAKILAKAPDFLDKVQTAGIARCRAFFNEPDTTPYHYERICFAAKFLTNPKGYNREFARRIAIESHIIDQATQGGRIALTKRNVAYQQGEIDPSAISNAFAVQVNGYLSQQWWRRPQEWGTIVYTWTERIAKPVKACLQMGFGIGILFFLGQRAFVNVPDIWNDPMRLPTLKLVGEGLAYAAGIELVYMLFTEGLDEALDPPMMGIAAAILIVASSDAIGARLGLAIALLVAALAGLFATKRYLFTNRRD